MAQNLQRKLPPSDTLIVYDVRKEVVDQFALGEREGGRKVEGAKTLEEIVDRAVSVHCSSFALCVFIWPPIVGEKENAMGGFWKIL